MQALVKCDDQTDPDNSASVPSIVKVSHYPPLSTGPQGNITYTNSGKYACLNLLYK